MIIMNGNDFPAFIDMYLINKYKMMTTQEEIENGFNELREQEYDALCEFKSCYDLEDEQGLKAWADELDDIKKFRDILFENLTKLSEED